MLDKRDEDWIDEQEKRIVEGQELIKQASDEALDYVKDAIENINDRQWRKMVMESQAVEMGVGVALAEHLVPAIYQDMRKKLNKRLKLQPKTAEALRHIYIGRVIKNIRKALNERSERGNQ